jgi:hypothetical protein
MERSADNIDGSHSGDKALIADLIREARAHQRPLLPLAAQSAAAPCCSTAVVRFSMAFHHPGRCSGQAELSMNRRLGHHLSLSPRPHPLA